MPQLAENVFKQGPTETLADIPRYDDGPTRVRFTHIMNPYLGQNAGDDRTVQELTFETMRMAARVAAPSVTVRFVGVTNAHEIELVPPDFIAAAPLTRSVIDFATFKHPRAMPLVFDVLDHGIAVPEDPPEIPGCEDYIIFTNTDISLQPHFYLAVAGFVKAGYDVVDVHRRLLPDYEASVRELPFMLSENGTRHGGCDCIVFPRRMYPSFLRNNACIGRSKVMRAMIFNCALQAKRYLVVMNGHLTFHLGNGRAWADPKFDDYSLFNTEEGIRVLMELASEPSAGKRLLASLRALSVQAAVIHLIPMFEGLDPPRLPLHKLIRRKLGSARKRLARKLVAVLSLWA
jgi:hypothetical protein